MKTAGMTLAVVAAVLSAAAQAQDAPARPSPEGERYEIETLELGDCMISFLPHEAGADQGSIRIECGSVEDSGYWQIPDVGPVHIPIDAPGRELIWVDACEAWPVIARGDRVMNPCWLTPASGGAIHVTRLE